MARLQVLTLPSEKVGEQYPFALILDQATASDDQVAPFEEFARQCGGRSALVTNSTIEVL